MAAKKQKPPIRFDDIETVRDALRWLKENVDDIDYDEAERLQEQFPAMFRFDNKHWADNSHHDPQLYAISNWRSWNREYEKTEGKNWWPVRGPGVLALRERNGSPTEEADSLDALDGYPLFDEDDHSELEMETQHENWKDYGRKELRSKIEEDVNETDQEAIEKLMDSITDQMLDDFVHQAYEDSGEYPEQDNGTQGTIFPDVLSTWDGSILELGELLHLDEHGYVVEIHLSRAAFDRYGRIVLRSQDLPEMVRSLVHNPTPVQMKYAPDLCDSPYLTCTWTGAKEIEARTKQEDYGTRQLQLPGVTERRRRA